MKLNKLLFKMKPDVQYRIIVVNEHNDILEDVFYAYRLPAPTENYHVIRIEPVYESVPRVKLYIRIVVREVFK